MYQHLPYQHLTGITSPRNPWPLALQPIHTSHRVLTKSRTVSRQKRTDVLVMCPSICTISGQLDGGRQSSSSWRSRRSFSASLFQVSNYLPKTIRTSEQKPANAQISDVWVKWWATANSTDPNGRLGYWLGFYGVLGALALVCLVISCW